MDTHITSAAELAPGAELSARLPGEPDPEAFAAANPSDKPEPLARASAPPPARRRRPGLLAGVAVGGVVLAGGAFVLSPYNHVVPLPARVTATVHQLAAEAGLSLDRPLAPSASLASVHLPAQPSAIVTPRYQPKKPDQDLKEILAMHAGTQPPSVTGSVPAASATTRPAPATPPPASAPGVAQSGPAPGFVPHEPGSPIAASVGGTAVTANSPAAAAPAQPTHPGTTDITQAVVAAATGRESGAAALSARPGKAEAASAPAISPAAASAPSGTRPVKAPVQKAVAKPGQTAAAPAASADAAERSQHLQAGPMTDAQQVQVLELVTQMATMVHELKQQDASLRADVAKTQEDESARLKDFERRIALAEARNAIGAAEDKPPRAAAVPPAPGTTPAVRPVSLMRAAATLPVDVPAAARRYRVQAASPGMAMLTEVERGGGDGAQLQVTVGDTIPGWGKVKSVAQRGTSWVVSTEHGVIE